MALNSMKAIYQPYKSIFTEQFAGRVRKAGSDIVGDMRDEMLGLDSGVFRELAKRADCGEVVV